MPPSNKRRIWDKKVNKRRNPDALTADIFALVIMNLSGFFHRVNFSRNSRFTINLVSVHGKINSVPLNKNIEKVNLSGIMFK